jgi:dephospho-CoA kinase
MQVIGLLGGVASGKSLVARQLAALGAGVLDADRAAHEVLRTPKIEAAARARWGAGIFGPDGRIDRSRLAQIVFSDTATAAEERKHLEHLTHSEVGLRLRGEAKRLEASGLKVAVLDVPLLLEAGWDKFCDTLLFVDAPRRLRLARARERGWNEKEFTTREGVQESLDSKRGRADVVVDNSGSPEQTRSQVDRFWRSLLG